MQRSFINSLTIFGPLLVLLFCTSATMAASNTNEQASAAEVRQEVGEAIQAIASYSATQRDAALAKAKESLAKSDARIQQLQQDIDENWQQMGEEARKQSRESLASLQKQRTEISEWYGGLKHSSANAWEEVKQGFAKSYNDFETSLGKAREKF